MAGFSSRRLQWRASIKNGGDCYRAPCGSRAPTEIAEAKVGSKVTIGRSSRKGQEEIEILVKTITAMGTEGFRTRVAKELRDSGADVDASAAEYALGAELLQKIGWWLVDDTTTITLTFSSPMTVRD